MVLHRVYNPSTGDNELSRIFPSAITIATGDITLTSDSEIIQYIDPNGTNRAVIFPTDADAKNLIFVVKHIGTNRRLTLDGNVVLRRNQVAWLHFDGSIWRQIG